MTNGRSPAPAVFDDALFDADVEQASEAGANAARAARKRFEAGGVPRDELRLCEAEGPEGAQLPHCLKVYLPPPAGRFGMVLQVEIVGGRGQLRYIAIRSPSPPARVSRRDGLRDRPSSPSRLASSFSAGLDSRFPTRSPSAPAYCLPRRIVSRSVSDSRLSVVSAPGAGSSSRPCPR